MLWKTAASGSIPGPASRGAVASAVATCAASRRRCRCSSEGYELTEKDYRELFLLHNRFGVALPAKYEERALGAVTGD